MKIKKLTANFGTLEGRTLEPGEGLTVLYAPNESGKSTWCAFLRVMLYGISTSERSKKGQTPDKTRYLPWNGTPMSGTMEVSCASGDITLRRWTERADRPMQCFSATFTGTETPVPGITADNAGERLTGMTRTVFERSVFIGQASMEISADPELDKRISSLAADGAEDVSFSETEKILKTWLRHRRSGKRGAIPEVEAELAETERTLADIERMSRRYEALETHQEELTAALEADTRAMEEARKALRRALLKRLSDCRTVCTQKETELQAAKQASAEAENALNATPFALLGPEEARSAADKDRQDEKTLVGLAAKIPPTKIAFYPLGGAVLAFLLALLLPWQIPCIGVGCILALLFVVTFTRLQGLQKTKAETLERRQLILDCYGVGNMDEVEGLLTEYRTLWQRHEQALYREHSAGAAYEDACRARQEAEALTLGELDFKTGNTEAARLWRKTEEDRKALRLLRDEQVELRTRIHSLGDRMSLASAKEELTQKRKRLTEQETALNLALETLTDADAELQQRLSPILSQAAAAHLAALTGGRYEELSFTRDLAALARQGGDTVLHDSSYLSRGTRDQLYLALRLAVCDLALTSGEICPLVLDDALVNFDGTRLERALDRLKEMSKTRQILLFTCHEREKTYLTGEEGVTVINSV